MFVRLKKSINFLKRLNAKQKSSEKQQTSVETMHSINKNISQNLKNLKNVMGESHDVIYRQFAIGINDQIEGFMIYIDGLVNKIQVSESIEKVLSVNIYADKHNKELLIQNIFYSIKENLLTTGKIKETSSFNDVLEGIFSGNSALFIDGFNKVLILDVQGWEARNVQEPHTETSVRGSREGYIENINANISMVRRRIKNPNLQFEMMTLGKQTQTKVCIGFLNGVVNSKLIEEVKNRLNRINTDSILDSGNIEQFIEDNPLSLFSTVGNTEKPDKTAAKILEGRVAIFCDGSPVVLTVPFLFVESFQVVDDYNSRPIISTFFRLFRLLSFLITLTTPAIYIALTTFHQEMLPTVLLITAAAAREGIPFPALLETLIMIVIFEILTEAGVRMPRPIGQAVSIVGALIIGQGAVEAGIIGAPMVIIIALTGISSFLVTPLVDAIIYLRIFFVLMSSAFGLYGIVVAMLIVVAHLCSLRSFGAPYLSPIAPTIWKDLKDSFIKAPIWLMKSRPKAVTWEKSIRQSSSLMPNKNDKNGDNKN